MYRQPNMLPRNESVWIEFEPAKKKIKQKDEELPIITLVPFTKAVHVSFGTLPLGKSKECPIIIKNVTDSIQEVAVEKFPSDKGFSISSSQFSIQPIDEVIIKIIWKPNEAGRFREILLLRVDGTFRSQAFLLGEVLPNKQLKNKKPFKVLHPSNVPAKTSNCINPKQLKTNPKTLNSKGICGKTSSVASQNNSKRLYGITLPYEGKSNKSKLVTNNSQSPMTPELLRAHKRRCRNNSSRTQKTQNRLLLTPEVNRNNTDKSDTSSTLPTKSHSDTNKCDDHESPPQQSSSASGLFSNLVSEVDHSNRQDNTSSVAVEPFSNGFEAEVYLDDNTACGATSYVNYQDFQSVPDTNGLSPNYCYEFASTTDRRQTYIASTNSFSSAEEQFNFCQDINQTQGLYLPGFEAKTALLIPSNFPVLNPHLCFTSEDANLCQFTTCSSPPCELPSQSDRRETYVTAVPFLSHQREITLPPCDLLATPVRRQTYTASTISSPMILPDISCAQDLNDNGMNNNLTPEMQNPVPFYQENICPSEMYVNEMSPQILNSPSATECDLNISPESNLATPESITKPGLNIWCKEFVSAIDPSSIVMTPEVTGQWKFNNKETMKDPAMFKEQETVENGDPYIYDWPFTPQETCPKYEKQNYSSIHKRKGSKIPLSAKGSPIYDSKLLSPVDKKPYRMKTDLYNQRCSKENRNKCRSLESSPEISQKHRQKTPDRVELPLYQSPEHNFMNIFVSPQRNCRKGPKHKYVTLSPPLKDRKNIHDLNYRNLSPPPWEYHNSKSVDIQSVGRISPPENIHRKQYSPEGKNKAFSKRAKSPGSVHHYPAKKLNSRQWSPIYKPNNSKDRSESNTIQNKALEIDMKSNSCAVDEFKIPETDLLENEVNLNQTVDKKEQFGSVKETNFNYHNFCENLNAFDNTTMEEADKIIKCSTSVKASLSPERNKQSSNSVACRNLFRDHWPKQSEDQCSTNKQEPLDDSNFNQPSIVSTESTTFVISSESSKADQKDSQETSLKNTTFQKNSRPNSNIRKNRTFRCAKKRVPTTLQLVKPSATAVPFHPNSHTARNLYYDERWVEKQTAGFTQWLNFILTPPDDFKSGSDAPMKLLLDYSKSGPCDRVRSRESLSLSSYTACRQMNRLRCDALKLFRSDQIVEVVSRLELEIETQRLFIRKDKFLHADIGIRQSILEMILCYNSLWLRIGLEVIYGEILPLKSNSDVSGLSRFITSRFLCDPHIASEYAHPTVPSLYKPGYAEALKKFTLKKFLILVLFLDKAKADQLMRHNPCLFCKSAKYKSSKELLISFSRDYLSGEGDVLKHLAYLGYRVSYVQVALDEFDFSVRNLAVDLRDGLRLTRLAELLVQNVPLLQLLRVPAISRLQKLHNAEVALAAFVGSGLHLKDVVSSQHIVDGHKEKTLAFLWKIIFHFQIKIVVNKESLQKEISYLERSLKSKANIQMALKHPTCLNLVEDDRLDLLLKWCNLVCLHYGLQLENFPSSFSDGRAICYIIHHYHPEVLRKEQINEVTSQTFHKTNASVKQSSDSEDSFTYTAAEPQVIQDLLKKEQENIKLAMKKITDLGGIPVLMRASDLSNTIPDSKVLITLLSYLCGRLLDLCEEIRAARIIQLTWRNFKIKTTEKQKKEIENKAAIVIQRYFKTFLWTRELKKKSRSAVIIQKAWRKYCIQKSDSPRLMTEKEKALNILHRFYYSYFIPKYKVQVAAATKIQSVFLAYLERKRYTQKRNAIINLQRHTRGFIARQQFQILQEDHQINMKMYFISATKIQRAFRAHRQRKELHQKEIAIIQVQKYVRGFLARNQFKILQEDHRRIQKEDNAARKIQAVFYMHVQRKKFLQKKEAVIHLQKHIRGFLVRKSFKIMRENLRIYEEQDTAARKIQAIFRGYRERKFYIQKINAIIQLQKFTRGFLARKQFKLKKFEKSVVVIQKTIRMFLARRHFLKLQQLTIKLQALVRRNFAKSLSWKLKQEKAATKIQAYYRMSIERQKYLKQKLLITRLQAICKGFITRKRLRIKLEQRQNAAIKIQRYYQNYLIWKRFKKMKEAAICLQAFIRGALVRKRLQRKKEAILAYKIQSAIIIQATYRGYCCQKRYKQLQHSVILIQAAVRGYLVRKSEYNKRQAVITIQKWYREHKLRNEEKRKFLVMCSAAIKIQTWIRMKLCRRKFIQMRCAVIVIQSHVRRKLAATAFRAKYSAVLTLQKHFKNYLISKKTREEYLKLRSAAILIQTTYRKLIYRCQIAHYRKISAAVIIQKHFRKYLAMKNFTKCRCAAVLIQKWYRSLLLGRRIRKDYSKLQRAALTIQSYYRANKIRREIQKQKQASNKIKALYKGWKERQRLKSQNQAARKIQLAYRHWKRGQMQRSEYLLQRYSCIIIQSAVRTYLVKCKYNRYRNAVICIQSLCRSYLIRKRYCQMRAAAICIQTYYRSYLNMKEQYIDYHITRGAVITLQSFYRSYRIRREFLKKRRACIKIQSAVRYFLAYKKFEKLKSAAIILQRYYRAKKYIQNYVEEFHITRGAIITLQAYLKGWLARKEIQTQTKAAIRIQRRYRWHLACIHVICRAGLIISPDSVVNYAKIHELAMIHATTTIQRKFRSYRETKVARQNFINTRKAVLRIQCVYRNYLLRKRAAIILQQKLPQYLIAVKERKEFLRKKQAIIKIQASWRKYIAQKRYVGMKQTAIKIQASVRTWLARRRYLKQKRAVKIIEEWYVVCRLQKLQFEDYHICRGASITIQDFYRKYKLDQLKQKGIKFLLSNDLNKGFRTAMQYDRLRFLQITAATREIQQWWKQVLLMRKERDRYLCVKRAIVTIQGSIRMCKLRRQYCKIRQSAIKIQAWYRMATTQREYQRKVAATKLIQHWYRRTMNRKKLSKAHSLCQKEAISQSSAAVKIQCFWRGYALRKTIKNKKLLNVSQRLQTAYENATEEMKLNNLTTNGLDYLFKYQDIPSVLLALKKLDAASRLSPVCCQRIADANGIPVLYNLICSCNRSVPHIEIIILCISILLNLAKYQPVTACVWRTPKSFSTIFNLMSIYREKKLLIFTKCCSLLWIFAQDANAAKILKSSKWSEKLRYFHQFIRNKFKLEQQWITRKNASNRNNPSAIYADNRLHIIQPDWILGKHMREFQSPMKALSSLIGLLEVNI